MKRASPVLVTPGEALANPLMEQRTWLMASIGG